LLERFCKKGKSFSLLDRKEKCNRGLKHLIDSLKFYLPLNV